MKKTHSASIGGTVFHIEEDAYEQLQEYLQAIEAHFRSYPDAADIAADIESRIAEQLSQREVAAQVVRMTDVERVIAALGRVDQFAAPEGGEELPPIRGRKLFRDPDKRIIAGVAAGLASYLRLPRLLVRIALLMLLFFYGFAAIAYLLMWALVPVANSPTEKLRMRGRRLTLAAIDQGVRDRLGAIPPVTRSLATRAVFAVGAFIRLVVVAVATAAKWVISIFVVGAGTLCILTLTVLLVMALVNASAPPFHWEVAEFFSSFGSWQHAAKIFLYLIVTIPLALIIMTAAQLFWGMKSLNARNLTVLLGVWLVSLLTTAGIWSSYYPELRQRITERNRVIYRVEPSQDAVGSELYVAAGGCEKSRPSM